jgi:hypothetical protein
MEVKVEDIDLFYSIAASVNDTGRVNLSEVDSDDFPAITMIGGDTHPDHIRHLAQRLWSLDGSQNVSKTSELLKERYNLDVSHVDIGLWAQRGKWEENVGTFHQALANISTAQTLSNLRQTALHMSSRIMDMSMGRIPFDKDEIRLALGVADRIGFTPNYNPSTTINIRGMTELHAGAFKDVTDAELDEQVQSFSQDNRAAAPDLDIPKADIAIAHYRELRRHDADTVRRASPPL